MSGYADALAFLQRQARPSGPTQVSSPALEAQRIDYETPLPEMTPEAAPLDDSLAFPQDVENSLSPLEEDTAAAEAPQQTTMSRGYSDALDLINRQAQQQAATQQAVAEATTPDDRLPIIRPELADALGVLDYRDPQEGQRRQQAAAVGEILNLPMFERVNLGAAPVNADGTVTIRRAQAVSPEAQAAADEQMEIIRLAAAKNLNPPTPSFLDKIQQRWRLGRESASDDQLAYRAMMGEVDYEKVKDQLNPSQQPQRGDNWLSEGFLGAVQMLPAMVDGIISGNKLGLQGAMAGGTAAAIAGQVGPQVVTPEEIVTVPAAAALGYSAGTAAGSSEYWYKQGAGSMYHALRKEGIPHEIASNVSAGFGAPYAGIELAQVTKLVPGLKQTAAQAVAGGLKKRLTALAVEKTGEYATQIGQETLQEANNITGEALAEWIAGVKPPPEKASAWDRIAGTIKESALSIPFLMAPKGVVDTVQTVRGPDQNQTTPPPPPPTAPAEVPQNFTPISSPAPAPGPVAPAPAPQNLGQVRAPEIPIDQAALDEAFGSPFAPPQPAPADPFATTPVSETTPTTSAAPAASIVPESTGSSELIAGEGSSSSQPVSSKAPKPNAATPPDNADFGPAFPEFTGNPIAAFAKLEETKTGQVPAALNHPTVGAVDVIWGQEGKSKNYGFGLSKILKYHPEARPILENLFDAFDVKSENENTIQLELGDYSAVLRKNWKGQEKRWLLTSFGRNSAADGRTIDVSAPVARSGDDKAPTKSGKQNKQPLKTNVNRFKSEAGYIDMGAVQDFGNSIYAAGVSFSKWAGQMLAKFGESISSALKSIWAAVSGQNYLPQAREQGSVAVPSRAKTNLPGLASNQFSLDSRVETPTNPIMPEEQRAAETLGQPSRGGSDAEDYRGQHKAPNFESAPAFDLTGNEVYPKDVYSRPDWYEQDNGLEEMRKIQRFQGNPEAPVWIHRAVPKNIYDNAMVEGERSGVSPLSLLIKEGDWVTTNKQYAKDHGEGALNGEFKVVSKRVKARDIFTNGDSIFEWGYYPSNPDSPAPSTGAVETTGLSTNPATPRNRKGEAGSVILPSREDLIQAGQNLYEAGMEFTDWASRMVQQFGEAVRDILAEIWKAVSGQNYLPQARKRGSVNISPSTGPKPRSFPQTVAAAPGVAPEVKAQLTALDYDPISNAQTVASARARIDAAGSMDSAVTQFMGNAANPDFQPTAVDYAVAIELLGELQARGRYQDAGALADFMASAATAQGQAIQALSLISRLTPAGIEVFAARQLQRAARNDPKIEQLIEDNERLRGEIATAKRDSATAAIVGRRAEIKSALPAGADPVATNIAIREAILQSPTPLAAQAATARILQDNGLSEKAAIRLAEGITKDFLKITTDTRAKVLQDLLALAETDRRLNKSKLGALIRLNREGKLSDSRLHADMAKMLGIPAWTSEHSAKVQRLINERERATDPRVKLVKAAEALDVIYREAMPPGILDKIDTYQTMAMLLNGLTQVRNLVGNISMAGVEIASDTVAQALDAVVGLGTGQRTRTGLDLGTRLTELGAGFQDIRAGYQFARAEGKGRRESFKEGVQTLIRLGRIYSSGKYDSQELTRYTGPVFNNPVMQTLENTLGAALSLADRGFYESAFKASLQNRMRTAAQNGTPMLAPDPDMIEQARMDAARAIYQDENIASKGFSGIRRVLNQLTGSKRWGLGSMVLKFTQVPGSILVRGLEFTPINTIRVLYETVAPLLPRTVGRYHIGKDFDQKAFTEAFARSLIGTGFLATGYWLSHLGILSGGMDSDDENERELAKAEGWGPYRINVSALQRAMVTGNFWTRQPRLKTDRVAKYDWLAPMSIGIAMGANMREGRDKILKDLQAGKRTSDFATTANWLLAAAGETAGVTVSAMNTVLEQPMLSNLNQLFVKAGHSDPISALVKTAADIPGTMIPTVVKQWARYEDNIVRETRDGYDGKLKFRQTVNELKAMLPGVSKTLPPRYDMEGNPVERFPNNGNTFFNVALNPAFVGYIKKSKLLSEMSDVYKATANGGVVPSRIPPKVSLEKVEITLMPDEISALQKEYGMLSVAAAEKFVFSDPYYEKATWEQRANALQKALTMAAKAAKYRVLQSRPDLYQRAKAEHIQRMESQRAANQQAQQDLAAVSQAMSQLQPGP